MIERIVLIFLTFTLLTGCSGGKAGVKLLGQGAVIPTRPEAIAHFVIAVPPAPPGALKAKFVSYATQSISIGLTGNTESTRTIDVSSGQSTYTLAVRAYAGSNTFTVNLYDRVDGTGNLLSTAQVTTVLALNQPNNVGITTNGVPASIQLSTDHPNPRKGFPATIQLSVAAKDAGGDTIVGPFTQSINLTNSDTTGSMLLASANTTGPATINLNYNGGNIGTVTIGAVAAGVAPGSVSNALLTPLIINNGVVSTLAGRSGLLSGLGALRGITFNGLAADGKGNLYVASGNNHTGIAKVTGNGTVTMVAGGFFAPRVIDGTGTAASFGSVNGIALDTKGNIFLTDTNSIRKVDSNGVVTTIAGNLSANVTGYADGTGTNAKFNHLEGIALDKSDNIYVADQGNARIRKVDANGTVTTYLNQYTTGTSGEYLNPDGLAFDFTGNLFVADSYNNLIWKIDTNKLVSVVAGQYIPQIPKPIGGFADGTGTSAQFNSPLCLVVDGSGNLLVGDPGNHSIRKIDGSGVVTTLAGQYSGSIDGIGNAAEFNGPEGLVVDSVGNIFVADGSQIRQVTPAGVVTTIAGESGGFNDGVGSAAAFVNPTGVAVDGRGNVFIGDNNHIRKVDAAGVVTTLAGRNGAGLGDGRGSNASFYFPEGLAVDGFDNLYIADASDNAIRLMNAKNVVQTIAGNGVYGCADGTGTAAQFNGPAGIALDNSRNLYVADANNNTIRKIDPNYVVTTLAGVAGNAGALDGTGTNALFSGPMGIAIDGAGDLFVADTMNNTIRKVTPKGIVTTLAGCTAGYADGTGMNAQFNGPQGIAVDSSGNIYVADYYNQTIRKLTLQSGQWVVTTVAGNQSTGPFSAFADGPGSGAVFYNPWGVAVDYAGSVFITDYGNGLVRKIQ